MIWCIGNGLLVRIKEDKWLPVKPCRSILSPLPLALGESKVSSLINPDLGLWETREVQHMFLPHEASLVLGIPLSLRKPPNHVAWSCTPSGNFIISSTYKLLAASASTNLTGSSNQDN